MKYQKVIQADFISRPNRFVAVVRLSDGTETKVHVKNTGRCREILVPGAKVYLEDFEEHMGTRKMRYDLIAAEKEIPGGRLMINMDSQAPNKVAQEALQEGRLFLPGLSTLKVIRPETVYGDSRFDFFLEDEDGRKAFMEVKGVTLEKDGVVSFPDAVTERGAKHLRELMAARKEGYSAFILFVVQMKGMRTFIPADDHDEIFGKTLREAAGKGVHLLCYDCEVTADTLAIRDPLEISL